ncbi:DUF6807 family protein [Zobellia alginiliquefaciens]|uniref:DUF6807 family protein n=1 Tax=Zobellia alginiliquefaciens TaxID=3032586 RepID=UPI0023E4752E|nr:DUF6807 family protein [Zobellia alginiliquefaciens]
MYRLLLFISLTNILSAQNINVKIQSNIACFTENKDSILNYQIADKSLNGTYKRSNYIHPLYTLDGQILTEDFPKDHLHHRGVFWAWHQLYINDTKLGDAWDINDFHWIVKSVKELKVEGKAKAIQAEVLWKTTRWKDENGKEKPVVREMTTIKVYPTKNRYRQIDIKISICALESNMSLGGAQNKTGYGGFSARVRLVNDIAFASSTGVVTPDILPVIAGDWIDISGSFSKDGVLSGLSILSHPDNPGFPNPWVLRSKGSMQNAVYPYPGESAVPLSETQPTTLRYRLLVHEGDNEALDIESIHTDFGKN